MLTRLAVPALAIAALLGPAPAHATIASTTTTYYFSGACIDCSGTGTAELVLANYTVGQQITQSNFVSLHYDGTNLIGAFTITAAEIPYVSGEIDPPLPGPEAVNVFGQQNFFESQPSGSWSLGTGNLLADYGTNGVYSAVPPAAAVPEPLSLTLMLTGLAGTALLRRRT